MKTDGRSGEVQTFYPAITAKNRAIDNDDTSAMLMRSEGMYAAETNPIIKET
jgi:hypothetical protein